jgi:hypothetical protein
LGYKLGNAEIIDVDKSAQGSGGFRLHGVLENVDTGEDVEYQLVGPEESTLKRVVSRSHRRWERPSSEKNPARRLCSTHRQENASTNWWKYCNQEEHPWHELPLKIVWKKYRIDLSWSIWSAARVRQIREGSEYLVSSPKNEDIVVALQGIAAGKGCGKERHRTIRMVEPEMLALCPGTATYIQSPEQPGGQGYPPLRYDR